MLPGRKLVRGLRSERGFVDPLSLFGIGFLVFSLLAVTYAITNPDISFNILEQAKSKPTTRGDCGGCAGPGRSYKWTGGKCRVIEDKGCAAAGPKPVNSEYSNFSSGDCKAPDYAWCGDCGGFCIKVGSKTCREMALQKCGEVIIPGVEWWPDGDPRGAGAKTCKCGGQTYHFGKTGYCGGGDTSDPAGLSPETLAQGLCSVTPYQTETAAKPSSNETPQSASNPIASNQENISLNQAIGNTFNTPNETECKDAAGGKSYSYKNGECSIGSANPFMGEISQQAEPQIEKALTAPPPPSSVTTTTTPSAPKEAETTPGLNPGNKRHSQNLRLFVPRKL
jgi:hypothetical protein